jgi:hypothetical protein
MLAGKKVAPETNAQVSDTTGDSYVKKLATKKFSVIKTRTNKISENDSQN